MGADNLKYPESSECVSERIRKQITNMEKGSDAEIKENNVFGLPNKFIDMWLQKLFSQIISVKIWVIALITVLLCLGLITNIQFISVLGIIVGMKSVFAVADVWKRGGTNGTIIDKV